MSSTRISELSRVVKYRIFLTLCSSVSVLGLTIDYGESSKLGVITAPRLKLYWRSLRFYGCLQL